MSVCQILCVFLRGAMQKVFCSVMRHVSADVILLERVYKLIGGVD